MTLLQGAKETVLPQLVYVINTQVKMIWGREILKDWILEEDLTKLLEKSPFYDTTLMHTKLNEFKLKEWNRYGPI